MKHIQTFQGFLNFEKLNEDVTIKNVLDPETELKTRNISFTEIDKSDRFVWKIKNGKKKVGFNETGPKWLKLIVNVEKKNDTEPSELDLKIHDLLSDWVISSLDDYKKRDAIAKTLMSLAIPSEYKEVDSQYIYRLVGLDEIPSGTFKLSDKGVARSWAYHLFGIEKMRSWYLDIYGEDNSDEMIVVKKPVANVIINIPQFYNKYPKLLSGKRHSALVFSEYEVICKNEEPLITVKQNEWKKNM